jgi:hypothetical protein
MRRWRVESVARADSRAGPISPASGGSRSAGPRASTSARVASLSHSRRRPAGRRASRRRCCSSLALSRMEKYGSAGPAVSR